MSAFRILQCRGNSDKRSEFVVEAISGQPAVGEEFRCWDTHHPADFTILEVGKKEDAFILKCHGWLGFDGIFDGALIDTAYKTRGPGFHYDRTKA
jgi:hypothetical protein